MNIGDYEFESDDLIRFYSIRTDDPQEFSGSIVGLDVSKDVAMLSTDVVAYHASTPLQRDTPSGGYVLVKHSDGKIRAWHPDWMTNVSKPGSGSMSLVIRYDDEEDKKEILNLLKSHDISYYTVDD